MKVTRTLHHSVNVEGHLAETTAFYQRLLGLADDKDFSRRGEAHFTDSRVDPARRAG